MSRQRADKPWNSIDASLLNDREFEALLSAEHHIRWPWLLVVGFLILASCVTA